MAKSINNTKQKKPGFSAKLLSKLHLAPDLSINKQPIDRGMFGYWWATLRKNLGSMFTNNLMFLLFMIPLLALVMFVFPTLEDKFIFDNAFNFAGDLGFGFTGATNDTLTAVQGIYTFRMLFYLLIIPCFSLAGIGAAGLFYSMRNITWGAKVKIRVHFFRGIKKYWWQFVLAFTMIGVAAYGVIGSITAYFYLSAAPGAVAPWWIWLVMVFACILALATVIFMMTYLPSVTMYKMKHRYAIKNSLILCMLTIFASLAILVLLCIPMALAAWSFTRILLLVFMAIYGFAFYALALQCFGEYTGLNYTDYLYEKSVEDQQRQHMKQIRDSKKNNKKNNANNNGGNNSSKNKGNNPSKNPSKNHKNNKKGRR